MPNATPSFGSTTENNMDYDNQVELEKLYNKNQTMKRLQKEFRQPVIVEHCVNNDMPVDFAIDLLCQMVLHKRASVSVLLGILGPKHFGEEPEQLQMCADLLLKAAELDLVDWYDLAQQFVVKINITADVQEDLDRYQYPLPAVIPPQEVRTNRDTGYFTSKGSIILKNNHHDDDVCLDHINRANKVPLKVNPDTARMIQNEWKGLDKKKPDEDQASFDRRVKAFEKYDRVSRDILEGLFVMGNEFYLTHMYDKRGRSYAQGYHVNTQGSPWNKAVVEFAEEELVGG